jgi:5'-3' exonuclease
MGLPQYLRYLIQRYPKTISSLAPSDGFDRAFIDFNGVIHQAAASTLTHASDEPVANSDIISRTLLETSALLLELGISEERAMLAIDGMPPMSKIVQQRSRRFVSSWRRHELNTGTLWDTNSITPGTDFMKQLSSALASCFPNAYISDSSVPGEGEAKICDILEQDPSGLSSKDVVVGTDGDLLIRAVLSSINKPNKTIHVMRQEREGSMYVDICALRDAICQDVGNGIQGIRDYILLMELVGNDFIPPITYLHHKPSGVPFLLALYRKEILHGNQKGIVQKSEEANGLYTINWEFLTKILREVAEQEDSRMIGIHRRFMEAFPPKEAAQWSKAEALDNLPLYEKHPGEDICPFRPGWRRRYYRYLLGLQGDVDAAGSLCELYLEGIQWMFDYYFNPSLVPHHDGWYYPHGYSPTAVDLYSWLELKGPPLTKKVHSVQCPSNDPQFQLLMVLPPQSYQLLPKELQDIVLNPAHGCTHMFPKQFQIFSYLKRYLWECPPRLPELNVNLLHNRYVQAKDSTTTNV